MYWGEGWVNVCASVYSYPQRPEKGIKSTGARVTGDCKPLDMNAGNTWVLC